MPIKTIRYSLVCLQMWWIIIYQMYLDASLTQYALIRYRIVILNFNELCLFQVWEDKCTIPVYLSWSKGGNRYKLKIGKAYFMSLAMNIVETMYETRSILNIILSSSIIPTCIPYMYRLREFEHVQIERKQHWKKHTNIPVIYWSIIYRMSTYVNILRIKEHV